MWSEDITNAAWASVGAPTKTANSVAWIDGNTVADTLTANGNNEGIEQDLGVAAASQEYGFSFWAKRNGGSNVAATITLEGVGGTPETTTNNITVTDTWTRFHHWKNFTAAATGNIMVKLTIDTSGESIYVCGLMAENRYDGTYGHCTKIPSP